MTGSERRQLMVCAVLVSLFWSLGCDVPMVVVNTSTADAMADIGALDGSSTDAVSSTEEVSQVLDAGPSEDTSGITTPTEPIALVGTWFAATSEHARHFVVSESTWMDIDDRSAALVHWDNENKVAYFESLGAEGHPVGVIHRAFWTALTPEGTRSLCTLRGGFGTLEEAVGAEAEINVDDATSGCDGGAWELIQAPIAIMGSYRDESRETWRVDSWRWESVDATWVEATVWEQPASESSEIVVVFDNTEAYVITAHLGSDGVERYARMQWSEPESDGSYWLCRLGEGLASVEEAQALTEVADGTDLVTGCAGGPWQRMQPLLVLSGSWNDPYQGQHTVDSWRWQSAQSIDPQEIISYDNEAGMLYVRLPGSDLWNPGTYAKIAWTGLVDRDALAGQHVLRRSSDRAAYYCTVSYGHATLDDAMADATEVDDTNPEFGGCGDFPWTHLFSPLELSGEWVDRESLDLGLSSWAWGDQSLVDFDNSERWAITQVPFDAKVEQGTFRRWTWTAPESDGSFWLCLANTAQQTVDEARSDGVVVDAMSPDKGGCGDAAWTRMMIPLELTGAWDDNYGQSWEITSAVWGRDQVMSFDNTRNEAAIKVSLDDTWNPGSYSRLVWTDPAADGSFWLCTVSVGHVTLEELQADETLADATDPALSGCGDTPWTRMFVPLETTGVWNDDAGMAWEVSSWLWGGEDVVFFDNETNHAITYVSMTADVNPATYRRWVWTEPESSGAYWLCAASEAHATATDAALDTTEVDATDPASSGCGEGAWTRVFVPLEITGAWLDDEGLSWNLSSWMWGADAVVGFDNDTNEAIVHVSADATWYPDTYTKLVWTDVASDGSFWACTVSFGHSTAEAASADLAIVDDSAPASGGCGVFPWTLMQPL